MVYEKFYNGDMTKKRIPTQEMLDDLSAMGDKDYMKKWNVSRIVPIKLRKRHGIKSFTPKHGIKRKTVGEIEYKWCPRSGGHWSPLSEFHLSPTRAGGYRGVCETHEKEDRLGAYHSNGGKEKAQAWRKTLGAKKSLRNTWRKQKAIKSDAYVSWTREDEIKAYEAFNRKCAYCGIEVDFLKLEFDHYIPIALGGKTEPKNMLPCCSVCNHGVGGKFKREPEEWIRSRFAPEYVPQIIENIRQKLYTV